MKAKKNVGPLEGIDGQLMVMAAHRYCLGRMTYIVHSCCEWLKANWDSVDIGTRANIMRDTIEALHDDKAGNACDVKCWGDLVAWACERATADEAVRVRSLLRADVRMPEVAK